MNSENAPPCLYFPRVYTNARKRVFLELFALTWTMILVGLAITIASRITHPRFLEWVQLVHKDYRLYLGFGLLFLHLVLRFFVFRKYPQEDRIKFDPQDRWVSLEHRYGSKWTEQKIARFDQFKGVAIDLDLSKGWLTPGGPEYSTRVVAWIADAHEIFIACDENQAPQLVVSLRETLGLDPIPPEREIYFLPRHQQGGLHLAGAKVRPLALFVALGVAFWISHQVSGLEEFELLRLLTLRTFGPVASFLSPTLFFLGFLFMACSIALFFTWEVLALIFPVDRLYLDDSRGAIFQRIRPGEGFRDFELLPYRAVKDVIATGFEIKTKKDWAPTRYEGVAAESGDGTLLILGMYFEMGTRPSALGLDMLRTRILGGRRG